MTKRCCECRLDKPRDAFYKRNKALGYLASKCKECKYKESLIWRKNNPDKVKNSEAKRALKPRDVDYAKKRARYARDPAYRARLLKRNKAYYAANKAKCLQNTARYAKLNPQVREKARLKYESANPGLRTSITANYRALKKKAAIAHGKYGKQVQGIYSACKKAQLATGIKLEVDHIVPLTGEALVDGVWKHVICGLHVPWNLRIVPRSVNRTKSNKFDPTDSLTPAEEDAKVQEWIKERGES